MSELTASSCGCNQNYSCNTCCNGGNWIWIIILYFLFKNQDNGFSLFNNCGCGCEDNNSCCNNNTAWIILLIACLGLSNRGCC